MKRDWIILCVTVGFVTLLYVSLGLTASHGSLILPLDDTYIHFQYARQMAHGDFYVYNPGDDPTSGATSFLYIPLLALGYLLGFHGLSLAYWAVGIGALALLASAWLIYRLILPANPQPIQRAVAITLMLCFAISGPLVWAAFSGMETSLFVCITLLALYTYQTYPHRPLIVASAAALAALARPEGALIALVLVAALGWRMYRTKRWSTWIILPLATIMMQPLINLALTGTLAASGTRVKSHLYNETIPLSARLDTVFEFWMRLWRELLTGYSPISGWYVPPVITLLALAGVIWGGWISWKQRQIAPGLLAGIWMLVLTAGDATLDTCFWQFKRYQMPVMALTFPLAGWMLIQLMHWKKWAVGGLLILVALLSLPGVPDYAGRYYENIVVTRDQQMAMARWIDNNLPKNARLAVHDVGAVRYVGNRATYDVVGLTTDNTAPAWRQGPGTFFDTMAHHPQRPDYMAIYPDFHGMPFLVQAGVFGEELQRFEVRLPHYTASAATGTQAVTRLNWAALDAPDLPRQPHPQIDLSDFTLVGTLNVADLGSEAEYDYEWWNASTFDGFISDIHELPYAACQSDSCTVVDGGRVLNGGERFTLPSIPADQGYLIVLRVQAASSAQLRFGCDQTLDTLVVPNIPGNWVEIAAWLPSGSLDDRRLCVDSVGGNKYYPYRYWIYAGQYAPASYNGDIYATFTQPGGSATLDLVTEEIEQSDEAITLHFTWAGDQRLSRDGKLFIHLYSDPAQPPVAQVDICPGAGILPPGDWLDGSWSETYTLPLAEVPPGTYQLAVGIYDPVSSERYIIPSDSSGRLFLGEIVR
jgi:hypothetical protein